MSVERLEDPPLVTGRGRFAADINFTRQLHMRIVRSNHAHGRIVSIDAVEARALPGVVAVWTAHDIADIGPIDFREGPIEKLAPYRQPVLATDKVRYVGDPVAAVFAEDPYVAEDAADLVAHRDRGTAAAARRPRRARRVLARPRHRADRAAPGLRRRRGRVRAGAHHRRAGPDLGPALRRAAGDARRARPLRRLARRAGLHGAAKVPHRNKELIARMLGRPPSSVPCYESHVGGGFGIRGELYPEDVLVCVAAMRLDRPVKWIEDRREHLIAANHSRHQHHKVRAAFTVQGEILAIDDVIHHDNGAYVRTHATRVAMMTCGVLPGPYRVPGAYRAICHFRLTNKTPAATYRAPGRFETTFVRERLIDAIAHRLNLDPMEVRRINAVRVDEMPFKRPLEALGEEIHFDSGDYHALLDKLLAYVKWDELNADLARRREAGEMVGAGLAMFVEKAGLGPVDGVRIQVDTSGLVEVITGGASLGQGFETVMAQVAAESLGTDYRKMRVIHGNTERIEHGIGAHASRATVMTASATREAALKVREKALDVAAELMQAPFDALDIVDGEVVRPPRSRRAVDQPRRDRGGALQHLEVARRPRPRPVGGRLVLRRPSGLSLRQPSRGGEGRSGHRRGEGRALRHRLRHRPRHQPDAGEGPDRRRLRAGAGRRALRGVHLQRARRSARRDVCRLSAADLRETPDLEIILTEDHPSPLNPLGIKGAGESGVNGVGGAIASAIDNAIGIPGAITELPVTPQKLKAIIDARK